MPAPPDDARSFQAEVISVEPCGDDGVVLAVPHQRYAEQLDHVVGCVREGGVFVDVKSMVDPRRLRSDLKYWSL